jgi:hypothetical protein
MKKRKIMKKTTSQHEILLYTGSNFSYRQLCSREENEKGKQLSANEELEKACWDGMIYEIFPELLQGIPSGQQRFIWQILQGKHYLYILIGSCPATALSENSLDPYFFMMNKPEN